MSHSVYSIRFFFYKFDYLYVTFYPHTFSHFAFLVCDYFMHPKNRPFLKTWIPSYAALFWSQCIKKHTFLGNSLLFSPIAVNESAPKSASSGPKWGSFQKLTFWHFWWFWWKHVLSTFVNFWWNLWCQLLSTCCNQLLVSTLLRRILTISCNQVLDASQNEN